MHNLLADSLGQAAIVQNFILYTVVAVVILLGSA